MSTVRIIEAIYEDGVFKPLDELGFGGLGLEEGQRVHLERQEDREGKAVYTLYVQREIEAGLRDADEGRVVDVDGVRARFGLE